VVDTTTGETSKGQGGCRLLTGCLRRSGAQQLPVCIARMLAAAMQPFKTSVE
jgi:hypothetical protein